MQQLSFMDSIVKGIPLSENEQQFILRNLLMTNQELANELNRTEASVRNFLHKNQIKRTEDQLYQIRCRTAADRCGERNPNFKGWASLDNYKYKLRSIARYPERHQAREQIRQAVRRGAIIRKDNCEHCGATGKIEMHHPDYSKPLEIEQLCRTCHIKADDERRLRELLQEIEQENVK